MGKKSRKRWAQQEVRTFSQLKRMLKISDDDYNLCYELVKLRGETDGQTGFKECERVDNAGAQSVTTNTDHGSECATILSDDSKIV